jgi:hypothetical protein
MSAIPFDIAPMSGIILSGGTPRTFAVELPSRGVIDKIVCKQINGVLVAFTVALFNNGAVADGEETSDSVGAEIGAIHEDAYRVTPDLSTATYGANGSLLFFTNLSPGGRGFPYVNTDPFDEGRVGIRPRRLYVRITPAGSGAQEYCLAIGGMTVQ